MQPWRTGGSFSFGGFWESVKTVAAMLFGLAILSEVVFRTVALVGGLGALVTAGHLPPLYGIVIDYVARLALLLVPILATLTYVDWRWGWKPDHIGAGLRPAAVGWGLAGVGGGLVAAGLSWVLGAVLSGGGVALPSLANVPWGALALILLASLGVEMTFRGAVISRFQADGGQREILLGAVVAPFGWFLIQQLFGMIAGPFPWTGIQGATGVPGLSVGAGALWPLFLSIALSLLFLRTDSVWLSAGLRFGMMAGILVIAGTDAAAHNAAGIVWAVVAAVLLLLAWSGQRRMPRRVQPGRGPRVYGGGRTVRGPWGPH